MASYINQYYLQRFLYEGDPDLIREAAGKADLSEWEKWHYAVLMEFSRRFFDRVEDFDQVLSAELRRDFHFLCLNTRQCLLLFRDHECDCKLVVKQIRQFVRRKYEARHFYAVSRRFDDFRELPAVFAQLEQQMEERFYHSDRTVFTAEEETVLSVKPEVQDSIVMEKISEDVSRKDVESLWLHFGYLKEKYTADTRYSAMYVKFVFSNVIQELFSEEQFADERDMSGEITKVYRTTEIHEVLEITEENIRAYEVFIQESHAKSRRKILEICEYIREHCPEEINPELLSQKAHLSPGYLSFIFKKETGMSIGRFVKISRMEIAEKLLREGTSDPSRIAGKAGFQNESYLRSSFSEFFGKTIEEYLSEPAAPEK